MGLTNSDKLALISKKRWEERIKLGDTIHRFAHPLAKIIDEGTALVGRPTNLQECAACFERRWKWGSDPRKWPPANEACEI